MKLDYEDISSGIIHILKNKVDVDEDTIINAIKARDLKQNELSKIMQVLDS